MQSQETLSRQAGYTTLVEPSSRRTGWLLVVVIVVGAVLRFAGIDDKSLWIDEAFSLWLSGQPLDAVWRTTIDIDVHPPLYYTLLHIWLAFGDNEAAVRSLSALLSVSTLPVAYLIGKRIGGRTLGLLTTGLLALSPLHVYYAQQARMYTMLTFFAAVSILCMLHLLDQTPDREPATRSVAEAPSRIRRSGAWWAGFVLSTALTMLSHNTAVLLPVAIVLFVAISAVRPLRQVDRSDPASEHAANPIRDPFHGLSGITIGLCAALALWVPWLPNFLSQVRRVDAEFWLPPPTQATFVMHWRDLANAFGPTGPYLLPIVLAVAGLALLGAWQLWRTPQPLLLILLLLLAPVAVELLISLRRPIFFTQTLVWTAIPLCVLLAAGLLRLRLRPLIAVTAGILVALNATALSNYYRHDGKENWRAAVQYVAPQMHPGDVVLFNAGWTQIPFNYYYADYDGPVVEQHGLPVDLFERGILEPKMTHADAGRIDGLIAGQPTVWLVYSHDWYTDPQRIIPARLSAEFETVDVQVFPGIEVIRYRTASD